MDVSSPGKPEPLIQSLNVLPGEANRAARAAIVEKAILKFGNQEKPMLDLARFGNEIADVDLVTVVPLYKGRLREREFNQSLLIAVPIAEEHSIILINALEKTRKTRYQNELLKGERLRNLEGAFAISPRADIKEKRILLIDDIMTTGSTLAECAKTLLKGGAGSVKCFTLARGI